MKRFDITADNLTGAIIKRLYLEADNPTYFGSDGAEPTKEFALTGFTVTSNAPCKVEIGMTNEAKDTFSPTYATYATMAVAGGIIKDFKRTAYPLAFDHATVNKLAVRITTVDEQDILIAGDVEMTLIN